MIRGLFSTQLRINMFSGVAVTVLNAAVLAVAYPIYLHFLGYEKYGVWLVLATVLSLAQLGDLGISQAIMKLVAEEYGRGNIEGIQQYVTSAVAILTAVGAVALVVVVALRTQIVGAFKLTGENAQMVSWLLPYIACLSMYVIVVHALNATLSGLGRMDLANCTQSAGRIAAVTTASALLYAGHGIESLLIGHIVSYVLIHVLSVVLIWRVAHIRLLRIRNLSRQRCKRLLRFGVGVCGGSLLNMLLSPFNKLMLSRYAGVSTIPVYEIAYNGSMQVRAVIAAGLRALMPEVSRLGANMTTRVRDRISRLNHGGLKLVFLVGAPVYAGLFAVSTSLFRIWLGRSFTEALPDAFRVMLIATFLSLICVPAYYTLLGLGRVRQCFYSQAMQTATNASIVLFIAMTRPSLSVMHVVCGLVAAMGITSVYVIWQNYRMLRTVACLPQIQAEPFALADKYVGSFNH